MNNTFAIATKNYKQLAPLFLRLVIGFGFMVHGWAKLSRGPAGFEKLLAQLNIPFPHIMAWVSTLVELVGGLAIFLGAFTSITAVPLIFTMLVAMFTIHIHYGFSAIKTIGLTPQGPLFGPPGYEINLLYIAGLISLVITGPGVLSVDAWLVKRRK
ncbi:DoxX family protein [Chitinophaga sp. GbtcB8]|uniref:HvfX family Cu-binding RiPP maturation protein n=1 Tax=Chitinophaga sp. GbtcB8 TaxID=2824753 RepID=UPI001C2F4522|nr:DoxX family protein [Chitinophaga sp. GbtcB8]